MSLLVFITAGTWILLVVGWWAFDALLTWYTDRIRNQLEKERDRR
jgi:hypothetical protein